MANSGTKKKKQAAKRAADVVDDTGKLRIRARGLSGGEPTRTDRRSEKTVDEILAATFTVLMKVGTTKLSVSSVCEEANISRGTLYRYFASKEELVDAAARHVRDQTDNAVRDAIGDANNPIKIFDAFIKYASENSESAEATRLLETEPEFTLKYFRDNFDYFKHRVSDVMLPVYNSWDDVLDDRLDRDLITEMFVRFALSETLVPSEFKGADLSRRLKKLLRQIQK